METCQRLMLWEPAYKQLPLCFAVAGPWSLSMCFWRLFLVESRTWLSVPIKHMRHRLKDTMAGWSRAYLL